MGNLLEPGSYVLEDTLGHLRVGSYRDAKNICAKSSSTAFLSPISLKFLLFTTPLEKHYSLIQANFSHKKHKKVNIMEVLASIIAYSSCSIQQKVELAFLVFDFDKSLTITKDEMTILCLSFLNGISKMTGASTNPKIYSEQIEKQASALIDPDSDCSITISKLEAWVMKSPVLVQLLSKNQSTLPEVKKRKSLLQSQGFQLADNNIGLGFFKSQKVRVHRSPQARNKSQMPSFGLGFSSKFYEHFIKNKKMTERFKEKVKTKELFSHSYNKNTIFRSRHRSQEHYQARGSDEQLTEDKLNLLKRLFQQYDLNSDGFVSLKELKRALEGKFSIKAIQEAFEEYDGNADGLLSLEDFLLLFLPKNASIPASFLLKPST